MDLVLIERTSLALLTASILGGIIGFERQWRQRTAGLRTNVLVAVGAAAFTSGFPGRIGRHRRHYAGPISPASKQD